MIPMVFKKRTAAANIKFILIFMGSFILCLVVYLNYANEKNSLSRQLNRSLRDKNELDHQLKEMRAAMYPLKNEVSNLRQMLIVSSSKEKPSNNVAANYNTEEKPLVVSENHNSDYEENIAYSQIQKPDNKPPLRGVTDKKSKTADPAKGLSRLKEHVQDIEQENVSLKTKVDQLNLLLEAKEKELSGLNKDNAGFKENLEKAVKVQEQLQKELAENLSGYDALKTKFSQHESEFSKFNSIKANLENQIVELNDKLASLTKANVFLEGQVSQYRTEKTSLDFGLDKVKEELTKQIALNDSLNKRVIEITDSLNARERERQGLVKELEQSRESKAKLEDQLQTLKSSGTDNENQLAQLKNQLKEANVSYESIRNTVTQLSSLLTKRESELNDARKDMLALQENFEKTKGEKDAFMFTLKEKERNISELNASLNRAESQLLGFQSELASTKERQKKTIQQLTELSSINSSLQQRLFDISKDLEPVGSDSNIDKRKAEELRKKVEVQLDIDKEESATDNLDEE